MCPNNKTEATRTNIHSNERDSDGIVDVQNSQRPSRNTSSLGIFAKNVVSTHKATCLKVTSQLRAEEGGMLKHLLSHWKSHRRKPTLLPEDADIQINDPSRVNPLYEDSEGSIASSHTRSEVDPVSLEDTRPSTGDINLDLVDISVPPKDNSESAEATSAEEAINHINRVLDNAFDNESLKSTDHAKGASEPPDGPPLQNVSSFLHSPNRKDAPKVESPSKSKELTRSTPVEPEIENDLPHAITKLIKQASITNTQQIGTSSSTSDVTKEPSSDSTLGEIKIQATQDQTRNERSPSEGIEKNPKEDQKEKEMVPGTSLKTQQSSEQFASPSTSEVKTGGGAKFPSKDQITESEVKNNTNLKTRAIDELIKKFQGKTVDDGPPLQNVPSFLHSPNRKEIPKVKSPLFKTEVKNPEPDNGRKKESLSTIFNFPPPPPLEPLKNDSSDTKNDSSDTKDDSKQTKTESAKPLSKLEDSSVKKEGTTRSDSSLSRNITVSSRDKGLAIKSEDRQPKEETKPDSKNTEVIRSNTPAQLFSPNPTNDTPINEAASKKETKSAKDTAQASSKSVSSTERSSLVSSEAKQLQPNPSSLFSFANNADVIRKDSKILNSGSKQKIEKQTRNYRKQSDGVATAIKTTEEKNKLGSLKATGPPASQKETEQAKSQSEDSGITRGDQISSEASPENPAEQAAGEDIPPSPPKSKSSKEKRTLHTRGKSCKRCKKSRDENTSLKRGQCDDYYDVVTGKRRPHRALHSESWASDLSWEEKELIRHLRRSRRGTLRSETPSTKSRHSRKHEKGNFHRHHAIRRSVSDESTINGSSLCSCDECWLFLVKDYAYGRASLRAMPPNQILCTCRPIRPDFLGRKVKFRSETIHEGSQSGRTSATPTIPEEPTTKNEDSGDTPTSDSNLSSSSQGGALPKEKANVKKDKKSKNLKENYRLVSPWELEEWDLAMRRHLLMKRRKRARYMGFMALAMVVFIGLIVAVLMVYLRRKVL